MDMIERVARVIYAEDEAWHSIMPWEEKSEDIKNDFKRLARAAIEAMMEPTEKMIAGVDEAERNGDFVMYEHIEWQNAWPIAIQAALEEK